MCLSFNDCQHDVRDAQMLCRRMPAAGGQGAEDSAKRREEALGFLSWARTGTK